jgi:gliding motility-associated-like protein
VEFQIDPPHEINICKGDSLFYLNQYYMEGSHIIDLQSDQGCDSSVQLIIRSIPIPQTYIGEIRLCQGDVFDFHGIIYSETGSYTHILQKSEEPYCDSIIRFEIIEIILSPIEDFILDCVTGSIIVIPEINVTSSLLSYEWLNEGGIRLSSDSLITIVLPGTYQLRITDIQSGCTIESNFFEIIDDRQLPKLEYVLPQSLEINCITDTLLIITQTEPNVIYSWSINSQQFSGADIYVTQGGELVFTAIDTISGCSDSVSFMISENKELPVFNLESDGSITCLKEVTSIELNLHNSIDSVTTLWKNEIGENLGEDILSLVVGESGMIYVSAYNSLNGCKFEDSIYAEDSRSYPEIEAEVSGVLDCNKLSVILTGKYIGIETNIEWLWILPDGSTQSNLQVETDKPGVCFFKVINNENGCEQIIEIHVIQKLTHPDLSNFNLTQIWCKGDKGSFEVVESPTGALPFFYFLNGEEIPDRKMNNLEAGVYLLKVIDQNGCISDTIFILQEGIELIINIDNWVEIDLGDSVVLDARINTGIDELESIQWYPEDFLSCPTCLTTLAFPEGDIEYRTEVSDKNGCEAHEYVFIKVNKEIKIFVPNAFSPNSDGINDRFTIFTNKGVENVVSMEIFDRWGNQVFLAKGFPPNDPTYGWDGTYKGQKMQPGMFIYTIEVELIDKSKQQINGGFHLIKG